MNQADLRDRKRSVLAAVAPPEPRVASSAKAVSRLDVSKKDVSVTARALEHNRNLASACQGVVKNVLIAAHKAQIRKPIRWGR